MAAEASAEAALRVVALVVAAAAEPARVLAPRARQGWAQAAEAGPATGACGGAGTRRRRSPRPAIANGSRRRIRRPRPDARASPAWASAWDSAAPEPASGPGGAGGSAMAVPAMASAAVVAAASAVAAASGLARATRLAPATRWALAGPVQAAWDQGPVRAVWAPGVRAQTARDQEASAPVVRVQAAWARALRAAALESGSAPERVEAASASALVLVLALVLASASAGALRRRSGNRPGPGSRSCGARDRRREARRKNRRTRRRTAPGRPRRGTGSRPPHAPAWRRAGPSAPCAASRRRSTPCETDP